MDKYKINCIFSEEKEINDIFIQVLNKELKKYISIICQNEKNEVLSLGTRFSLEGDQNC